MRTRFTVAAIVAVAVTALLAAVAPSSSLAASPAWKAIAATGPTNMDHYGHWQKLDVLAGAGTFNLTFEGDTTIDLPYNASAATVRDALEDLPAINGSGGSVSVYGGTGGVEADPSGGALSPYIFEFAGGDFAGEEVPALSAADGAIPLSGAFSNTSVAASVLPSGTLAVYPANVGGAATSGAFSVTVGPLPAGFETAGEASGPGWSCPGSVAGQSSVTCTRSASLGRAKSADPVRVPLRATGAALTSTVGVTVSGGGATPGEGDDSVVADLVVSDQDAESGVAAFWAGAFDADGRSHTQAGGHPDLGASFFLANTVMSRVGLVRPAGDARDVLIDLPAGFIGNPQVAPRCPRVDIGCAVANPAARLGSIIALTGIFPSATDLDDGVVHASNDEPPTGYAAQISFPMVATRASVFASVRNDSDYGVSANAAYIPTTYSLFGSFVALDGIPVGSGGKAFWTNPTDCRGDLPTWISTRAWQAGSVFSDPIADFSPAVTGCGLVPFDPAMSVQPTVSAADSASGLQASIDLPQENLTDPNAISTSHLKKTVVELPEGLSVNPSGATGLKGCSDAQIGIGSKALPSCPDASKIGTVDVRTPVLGQPLDGVLYLGTPKSTDPESGEMLRLFLVVRNDRYGILVKLPGFTTADPVTGRLTATFDENPRVPFDHLDVELRGGSKGLLATPRDCGEVTTTSTLSPWSGTADVQRPSPFTVDGGCGSAFAPRLAAGMSNAQARIHGTYRFKFSREDGEQWIDGLTAKLPKGLLASVKDVPLCTSGQAAAGACPESSRIGTVDATAGSGDPFVLERKGAAYLTEGYKGCAYGLLVSVPVVAGPFDGSSPETDLGSINVRQAVCVDPTTAEVSATSDPLPTIWHGIPVRVRSVTVLVDRASFMLNPSNCTARETSAVFDSDRNASANAASPFHAAGCAGLAFKPNLSLALTGKRQVTTGKHPGVKAQVTQAGIPEAGIEKAVVRLPKSLALDPDNAQSLCEFVDGTKPDLENHCPKGSIVGRARAKTPLLKNDLAGNVYFVKNVRRDPKTGNEIRTLPMVIVALRGEIAVNLRGESDTTKAGKLVNTFNNVPDAPISRFNLNINGGRNGILAVTRTRRAKINLCAGRHTAESEMDGQNGRRYDRDIRMKTPCTKRQTKRAKRAATKAKRAAKARRG